MYKPTSKKGFRATAARVLDKTFGATRSTASTSPKQPSPTLSASIALPEAATASGTSLDPDQPSSPEASPPTVTRPALVQHSFSPHIASTSPPSTQLKHEMSLSAEAAWDSLQTTLRGLHRGAGLFPPLQSAVGGVISCLTTLGVSSRNKRDYRALATELEAISASLNQHLQTSGSARMSESISRTARMVQEQVELIYGKRDRSRSMRLFEAENDEATIIDSYRQIQALFQQLQLDASLGAWSIVNRQLVNTRLEGLKAVMLATHDSSLSMEINRRNCTENTRIDVLSGLDSWYTDPDSPNVYWMNGLAGTGKTTIACTFADTLKKRNQLAASFFCTRSSAECQDVTRIIPTIAYQLARYSTPFQSALCRMLEDNPDLGTRMISTQFESLLKNPLMEVKAAMPEGLVVVIDALDECTASSGVETVLDTLLRSAVDLPLKFFVASRPAPNIRDRIETRPDGSRIGVLHDIERSLVQGDIRLYIQEGLPSLPMPEVEKLAERSGSLFIYAAMAVRYIQAGEETGDLDEHVAAMLSGVPVSNPNEKHTEIDELYLTILRAADEKMREGDREGDRKERMRHVLWTVVCAREPITIETLALLANVEPNKAKAMLRHLHSVLYKPEGGDVISTIHASFTDFMLDLTRSGVFFCDSRQYSWLLTRQCFRSMQEQLRFNICRLDSSHQTDQQVPQLKERVEKAISPTLGYVCQYWGDHLNQSCDSNGLYELLDAFLSEQLLFWMEVMNLKRRIGEGVRAVLGAKLWLAINHPSSELLALAEDARNFVTSFAANAICQSTPHIYVSALSLAHHSNGVYQRYWNRTRGLIEPKGAGIDGRYETTIASWKAAVSVLSVAYSRDGAYIVFGGKNGTLTVRDAYDGTTVGGTFDGHTGTVYSVAFSFDGTRIVSGSEDCTVRVWDVQDGTPAGAPFQGHLKPVTSVAFSPDGTYIASGSRDGTARVWNVRGGGLIGTPFQHHTGPITSLAISPDGKLIASGSGDRTIRVWHASDGTLASNTLEGHTQLVSSVAFSPDGSRIVSGSDDHTVRLWDVQSSSQVGTPFRGHTGWITSVAFSPDGSTIASASQDRTVRVWRVQNCEPVGAPFDGHTQRITSISYSPDGTRIVSGSFDRTVRIWRVQGIQLVDGASQGHRHIVLSVAFSPDGKLVASGSSDGILRVWSALDGSLVNPPFIGHSHLIVSVTFSPDSARIISGSSDRTIRVWNIADGSLVFPPLEGHSDIVSAVAVSSDGRCIASGSGPADCTIRLWDVHSSTPVSTVLSGHTGTVNSVAFSPDGRLLVSGSSDRSIRIWSVQDGSLVGDPFTGHTGGVRSVTFSPDATRIVSGSVDFTLCVWDVKDGSLVGAPLEGHTDWVSAVAASPDGTRVASSSWDRTIRLWNMQDGKFSSTLHGHTDSIESIAFSPNGMYLVSGSRDSSIRVWDVGGSTPAIGTWTTRGDGWVVGHNSELLFWLPSDLSRCLPTPYNEWSIGPQGPIYVDYESCLIGSVWHQCYLSE